MSRCARLVSHLMFASGDLLRGHGSARRLRELEQSKSWPSTELEQYRIERPPQTVENNPASVLP